MSLSPFVKTTSENVALSLAESREAQAWPTSELSYVPEVLSGSYVRRAMKQAHFDGVEICVSIDYLTKPVEVLREVGRVLKVGAPLIITFSNRCFPSKAVAVWHQLDDRGHMRLVESYLEETGTFRNVRGLDRSPRRVFGDPLYAVVAESTGPYVGGLTG
jgi:SAM-dependent methyltransferase